MKKVLVGMFALVACAGMAMADGKCPIHGKYSGGTCPTCYGESAANRYGNTMTPSRACDSFSPSYKKLEENKSISSNNYNQTINNFSAMNKSKNECVDAYSSQQYKNQQQQLQNQQQPSNK